MLSVKRGGEGTKIDYTCKEVRGKTKEGENERASPGADGASANETMLFDNGAVICHECRLHSRQQIKESCQ